MRPQELIGGAPAPSSSEANTPATRPDSRPFANRWKPMDGWHISFEHLPVGMTKDWWSGCRWFLEPFEDGYGRSQKLLITQPSHVPTWSGLRHERRPHLSRGRNSGHFIAPQSSTSTRPECNSNRWLKGTSVGGRGQGFERAPAACSNRWHGRAQRSSRHGLAGPPTGSGRRASMTPPFA